MVYNNFLSIAQAWIVQQRISLPLGLWGVHATMLLVLLLLFFQRLTLFSVFRYIRSP